MGGETKKRGFTSWFRFTRKKDKKEPEATAPEPAAPEPDAAEPSVAEPQAHAPVLPEPESHEPETHEPETHGPETHEPAEVADTEDRRPTALERPPETEARVESPPDPDQMDRVPEDLPATEQPHTEQAQTEQIGTEQIGAGQADDPVPEQTVTPALATDPADDLSPVEAQDRPSADQDREEPQPRQAESEEGEPEDEKPVRKGFFARLRDGLSRSTNALSEGIAGIFTKSKLDDEMLEELEDLLIMSDIGVDVAREVTAELAKNRYDKAISPSEVREHLAEIIARKMEHCAAEFALDPDLKPHVVLVVGVNGTGKTTTIGKLAHYFRAEGSSVMLAAGDTFRAAAIEQLKVWGERTASPVLARNTGADAAGLAFDAYAQAKAEGRDILLIDTAGRLQNKQGLMEELAKITRVLKKQDPDAPHSVLLVLDATTGQNALNQVEVFQQVAGVTGLVMTKLDGTARGGILVAIAAKYGLPIHAIGVGEGIEDFQPFDPETFARALTGADD